LSIVNDDGEMQMHPGGIGGIAGVIPLEPEQGPRFDMLFCGAGGEF
jgi:hypothetical protein